MIPIQIQIIEYKKETNDCIARLQNGNFITIDPFASCAVEMTDEEYEAGKGYYLVGNSFVLTSYSVRPYCVTPHEDGMKPI